MPSNSPPTPNSPPIPQNLPAAVLAEPYIQQLLRAGRQLSSDDYRRDMVDLSEELSSSTASGSNTYRVPNTHKLLIMGVRPHVVIVTPSGETEPMTGMATAHAGNRLAFKASNCRVTLTNTDSNEKILGENNAMPLSSIMGGEAGGAPLDWRDAPHIVLNGATLQLDVSLVTSGTNVYVGAATEYGVVLDVALVRVIAS